MPLTPAAYFDHSGGLNTKSSPMAVGERESPDMLNIDLSRRGGVSRRKGSVSYTSSAIGGGSAIDGLFRLQKSSGAAYMLAATDGSFYEDSLTTPGDFSTSRGSGFDADLPWIAQGYGDKLYLANGYDEPQVYAGGSAVTRLADESGAVLPAAWTGASQPSGFELIAMGRAERMSAWGVSGDTSRVWFSSIQDPTNWSDVSPSDGFNVLVLKDNGEAVQAVRALYDYTVIFKKTQMAIYSGSDGAFTYGDFTLRQVLPVGTVAPRSIVQVGRDLYWWSQQGPVRLSGVQEYGDLSPNPIHENVETDVNACNWRLAHQIVALHDKDNSKILWAYPKTGSIGNSGVLVYHYDLGAWSRYEGIEAHAALAFVDGGGESSLYVGRYDGHVRRLGVGYTDDDTAVEGRYITPWYGGGDFAGNFRVPKMFPAGDDYDCDVYAQWDLESDWHSIGNLEDFRAAQAYWDTRTWDTTTWEDTGGIPRIMVGGQGRVVRFKFESTSTDSRFSLHGWELIISPRGFR